MVIDIICLIFLAYGFWVGYSKGIIATVLTLSSYLFAILAAMKFGPVAADMLYGWFPAITKGGSFLLGIVVVAILTLVLFRIVARGLTSFLENINVNFVNQIAGGVLSGLFFVFIYSGLVYFGDSSRMITEELKANSITYRPLNSIRVGVWNRTKDLYPVFRDFYDRAVDAMDRVRDNVDTRDNDDIFDLEE